MKHIEGYKHSLECRCVLPQFQDNDSVIFHQFTVFSTCTIDNTVDNDIKNEPTIEFHETIVACPNCNLLHRVTGFCRSTILNEDDNAVAVNIDDLKVGMPDELVNVLDSYNCDLSTFEEVKFAYATDALRNIILRKTITDKNLLAKVLIMNPGGRYTIETKKFQLTF